jgi:hypothetical protein
MEKKLCTKRDLVIGIIFLLFGTIVTSVLVQPVSAVAPRTLPVITKSLVPRSLVTDEEWFVQATAFSDRNRGIGYISCVNESIVWASAFDGDNPAYPC